MSETSPRVLAFAVGTNLYDRIFARCIASQREYAARCGYDYLLVRRPYWSNFLESAWLKIPLLLSALEAGYDWVVFLDADCLVRGHTPPVQTLEAPGKALYIGRGFSGNVNSGVMIVRNGADAREFFARVLAAAPVRVPETDLGENGHVIHFCHRFPAVVQVIERRWNNNADLALDDYVRHYSGGGPMRDSYRFGLQGRGWKFALRVRNKLYSIAGRATTPRGQLAARLQRHLDDCRRHYPLLAAPDARRREENVAGRAPPAAP